MRNKLLVLGILLSLCACSSHHVPAPVVSLSTTTASPQNLTEITGNEYTVEPGDTLFAIAFYSGNDYRELAKINDIQPPYSLNIGQRILLHPPANSVKKAPKLDTEQVVQTLDKIEVDRKPRQEYGVTKPKKHRKNQDKNNYNSIKPDKVNENSTWIWPASGANTIATIGSDGTTRGLNIKGVKGSTVVAAAGGKVVYAGNALKGYGNLVIIKHDDQYLSAYAHNESILVTEQTYVAQGQQIATMGNSGASDVLLHFEIRKMGKSMNPFKYLPKQ